jgi:hypothetical protein
MTEANMIELVDLVQQALAQESANTKVVMQILNELQKVNSALADRVETLEKQVITIITTIRENQ